MAPHRQRLARPRRARGLAIGLAVLALACTEAADPLEELRALQRRGRFAASIEPLRELVDEDPSRAAASLLLGVALLRTGEAGLAVWPLRRAAEAPQFAVEAGMLLTRAMLESRTAPDAVTAIDRVLALQPENVNALALRVQTYLATNRYEDALAEIKRVLELDPENVAVLVPRAIALIGMRRVEEAEAALEAASKGLETSDEEAAPSMRARLCIARGLFALEKQDPEGAEAQYARCLEEFPTHPLAVTESVSFYQRIGRPERATEILEQAFEESGSSLFRVALAQRLRALGDPEGEERLLRADAEERPSPASWFTLADLYVKRDEFDAALEAFEAALAASRAPSSMLRFAYADTLVQAERYAEARRVAEGLEQPVLRDLIRGRALLGEGDAAGALAAFEAGIRLWPNNAAARFLAGQAAERVGDFQRAVSHYRESIRANAAESEAGLALAELYAARGDHASALDAVSSYNRTHPDDPRGYLVSIRIANRAGTQAIVAQGLHLLAQLPDQSALAVAEEATLIARGRGPAPAVELVDRAGLDLADPANEVALRILISQLAALGENERAAALVAASLEAHPEEGVFHELHGHVLRTIDGRPEPAREAFSRALELDPEHAPALVGLAELAAESGERDAAIALYDRAAEADAGEAAYPLAAVQLLLEVEETEAARPRLEQLLVSHPREAGAAIDLARILAEQGELDRALELAERAAWLRAAGAEATLIRIRALHAEQGERHGT